VKNTYTPAIVDEICEGFLALKTMYRLICGMPV